MPGRVTCSARESDLYISLECELRRCRENDRTDLDDKKRDCKGAVLGRDAVAASCREALDPIFSVDALATSVEAQQTRAR